MFVKICGVTSAADATVAAKAGADAVGLVLSRSSRRIGLEEAAAIAACLPPETAAVAVVADMRPEEVLSAVSVLRVGAVQLHGHEPPEEVAWISERVPTVIKAVPAGSHDLAEVAEWGASIILVDSARPGSGERFDWASLPALPPGKKVMLAGGLNSANVSEAIALVHPWGVDVSSGVEASPGRKDERKVRAFIAAAKLAGPPGAASLADKGPYDWAGEI